MTPQQGVLEGITRRTVLELGREMGLAGLRWISSQIWRYAEEVFATSTAGVGHARDHVEGEPVGDGEPGAVTQALRRPVSTA